MICSTHVPVGLTRKLVSSNPKEMNTGTTGLPGLALSIAQSKFRRDPDF